jgi:hypothetical protein
MSQDVKVTCRLFWTLMRWSLLQNGWSSTIPVLKFCMALETPVGQVWYIIIVLYREIIWRSGQWVELYENGSSNQC